MKLTVIRYSSSMEHGGSTQGLIFVNDKWYAHTLEDERRDVKVPGETCIPDMIYKIAVRKFGRHHDDYSKRFPDIHKGMLEVKNVPGFTDILIHILNTEKQTEGCLGVGDKIGNNVIGPALLELSTQAYLRFYKAVIDEALKGEVIIEYKNIEI